MMANTTISSLLLLLIKIHIAIKTGLTTTVSLLQLFYVISMQQACYICSWCRLFHCTLFLISLFSQQVLFVCLLGHHGKHNNLIIAGDVHKNIKKVLHETNCYVVLMKKFDSHRDSFTVKKINLIQIWYLESRIQYLESRIYL